MRLLSFTLILLLVSVKTGNGQKLKQGYIRMKKVDSFRQIFELKNGCLIVMLHTNQNKIEALKSIDQNHWADTIQRLQSEKNSAIIQSFHAQFDFCPVYFFLNSEALQLLEYGADSITFLNDNLFPDTAIQIKTPNYFVAEFGVLHEDPDSYLSGQNMMALTIQSNKLIQLKKPFPYYIGIKETERKIVNIEVVIAQLNERMKKFEEKAKMKIINKRFSPYFKQAEIGQK